jgi:NADH-quinone oxidoreductase subunit G
MINLEIDGQAVAVENGRTVMDAAHEIGMYIPHFCYHKKLSIAASCRMCLVQVEKAPKPLPACATPVVEGMKVHTRSDYAVTAQKGVMEFLLINHPLDCPICDQGGECMLQDVAMGYGGVTTRFDEDKHQVLGKPMGALISAQEMSRCIHCTRCVRFGQEVAGVMEIGMANRGEHSAIMTFVQSSVDSELSGNMIDLCPVGALTSKPFRYTARSWELSRRKSVSPHDSLGSNLVVQVKNGRVMRVTPLENEAVNECWISDRDRFSYEGLNSADRLTKPMLKQDGKWIEVEWRAALEYVANALRQIGNGAGAEHIGALATGSSTAEELYLLQKLVRGLGSENVDFRLRQSDFSADGKRAGAPWLGMAVAEVDQADRFLLIGSFLRKDHPLLAHRVREAVRNGAQLNVLHAADDDLLINVANKAIVTPGAMRVALLEIVAALAAIKQAGVSAEVQGAVAGVVPSAQARDIAASLASGKRAAILLGNFAAQHPEAAQLQRLAQEIAALTSGKHGFLGESANSVGGYLVNAVPGANGLNAAAMLAAPRKAYLLLNVEAELDCADAQQALAAMKTADLVVAMSAYKHRAQEYADVMLPIAPFTETSGSYVSTEGRVQSFKGAVKPLGETRPAWKVLRVLGNLLELDGFDYDSSEAVRDAALSGEVSGALSNAAEGVTVSGITQVATGLQRVADVPIYATDSVVRRAASLQQTRDAAAPMASMNSAELARMGIKCGDRVKVAQGLGSVQLSVKADDGLTQGVVRVAAGHPATAALGAMFGTITVEAGERA